MSDLRSLAVRGLAAIGLAAAAGFLLRLGLLGEIDARAQILAIAGAVALLLYAALAPDKAEARPIDRAAEGFARLALACLCGVGLLGWLWSGHDTVLDVSTPEAGALSPHTLGVLQGLTQDITVHIAAPHHSTFQRTWARLVEQYASQNPHVRLVLIDPDRNPSAAARLGELSTAGEIVLESADRREHVIGNVDESALTAAITRVVSRGDAIVCWSLDHGEANPDDTEKRTAMGRFVFAAEAEDVFVQPLGGLASGIPETCKALVIARPQTSLAPAERDVLSGWLSQGHATFVLLEPDQDAGLAEVLAPFGLHVGVGTVRDPDNDRSLLGIDDDEILVLSKHARGTAKLATGLSASVVLAGARPLDTLDVAQSKAEALLVAGPQARADKPADPSHPIALWAIAQTEQGGRIVLSGDADVLGNAFVGLGANLQLGLDSLAWLLHRDDVIGARPMASAEPLTVTTRDGLELAAFALVLWPLIGVAAAFASFRRRAKG